jgi:sugar-specific transcriptional regulator TrmB
MSTKIKPLLSKQATAIYRLLLQKPLLSAQEIAMKLIILPNAVYRTAQTLIDMGLIEGTNSYPVKYQAKSKDEAVENYINISKKIFLTNFHDVQGEQDGGNGLSVSFIKTRAELLQMTQQDILTAQVTIDHIVSGLEIPAETILALKKSSDRGIKLRFLIQNLNELNREMITNWQKMGLRVRYYPMIEARIIIFDSRIIYLTSYNPQNKDEAIGVRFAYPPIAKQMSDLFERRWKIAEQLS